MSSAPSTHRESTAGSESELIQTALLNRAAVSYFEKFERYECQELLAYTSTHWTLSTDDFKLPTEPPAGLVSAVNPLHSNRCLILLPVKEGITPLCYRELHQIVRDLTLGIYVLHQHPMISLETNFDQSTSCQLPPAYHDTRVGQILIAVDYMLKGLWHGAYFPKDKRTKFSERWRLNLDVNANGKPETKKRLLPEFVSSGIIDVGKDEDYKKAYDNLPLDQPGDIEMAEERRFFMAHVESLSMHLTFAQQQILHHKDVFVIDPMWNATSCIKLLDEKLDHIGYERLNTRLQMHEQLIRDNFDKKPEIRRQLELLKLVSFLTPLLIGMRKRMKIPDTSRLLQQLTGDETKTERELPPLMLDPDFKCKNFSFGSHYFNLHGGIMFDMETDSLQNVSASVLEMYDDLCLESAAYLNKILDPDLPPQEHYDVPIQEIDGKSYYVMLMEFETYYPSHPQKPLWVRAFHEEISKLKPKKLPIGDIHLHEQFRKYFGYKKAIKYKTPQNGLKAASQRGLVATFQTLCRKMPASRLGKQDENGLSLLHHASMNNHPQIVAMLLLQSMDVNVRKNNLMSTGPTALHLACRCGSLDVVACLVANYANVLATDQDGWAPIHHAAYYDQEAIVRLLFRKNEGMLELTTKNNLKSSPLLLAASSGGLAAVKTLIKLGGDIQKEDGEGSGMINLAAMHFHTNILEYLIQWNNPDLPVWYMLVKMLKDDNILRKDSAVKCLEVLSTSHPDHWRAIIDADGIPALVDILKIENEELQSVAASVLCNISEHDEVRRALTWANSGPILISLLGSSMDDIQSRASIILSDLACITGNQDMIANSGGIPPLVNLLDSELEDVLVNAVNAIRVLCTNNWQNQASVAEFDGLKPLVEFLTVNSDILQAATSAAIASVATQNSANQDAIVSEGAVRPLVDLIKGRVSLVQLKATCALEALADNNASSQKAFLELDAPKALIRLLKSVKVEMREQTACALWSLAGSTKTQQRLIAERIGIPLIIQMLLEATEKLLSVGCRMAIALGQENFDGQNQLAESDAFNPIVRLLRSNKISDRVLLMVVKAIGALCVGVAYRNNRVTQKKIAEEGAIHILVNLLMQPPSEEIQVEVANTLACIVLSNSMTQEKLLEEEETFKFHVLLDLLKSKNEEIRLKAGMALTVFAFNNTPQQYAIREAGGIKYSLFSHFLKSEDETHQCLAAFQMVVLARVIVDQDQVTLTAQGIKLLVSMLQSTDEDTLIMTASLLSSLAHTRAGIPDAMITTGAIVLLIELLASPNDQVRSASAVALGYLTFNRTAARLLFADCRNMPGLYKKLMNNIGTDPKINPEFVEDFKRALLVGLPTQCLEINGGYPIIPQAGRDGKRPSTTRSGRRATSQQMMSRAMSAPAGVLRARQASSLPAFRSRPVTEEFRPHTTTDDIEGRQSTLTQKSSAHMRKSSALTRNSSSLTRNSSAAPRSALKTQLSTWR